MSSSPDAGPDGFATTRGGIQMSELSIWQEIALMGLAALALFYVFIFRVWLTLATGADLLFVAALALCVSSIAFPHLFESGARRVVHASPLPGVLVSMDARIEALEALPGELVARALAKVGYESEPIEMPMATKVSGRLEANVRPAVEGLVALLLRFMAFGSSLFVLMICLALRSATTTSRQLQKLGARVDLLEAQLVSPSA
jgi:hypothetical protein